MPAVDNKEKHKLIELYKVLSEESRHEVLDFADYLAHKNESHREFPEKSIQEVAGCLPYTGNAKTIEEMDYAVARGVKRKWQN